jgi:hypothetical protein
MVEGTIFASVCTFQEREREIRVCVQPSPRDAARNPQGKGRQQFAGGVHSTHRRHRVGKYW